MHFLVRVRSKGVSGPVVRENTGASLLGRVLPAALPRTACVRMGKAPGQSKAKRKTFWPALQARLPHFSRRGNGSRKENAQNAQHRRRCGGKRSQRAWRSVMTRSSFYDSGANSAALEAPPDGDKQVGPRRITDFGQTWLAGAPTPNPNGAQPRRRISLVCRFQAHMACQAIGAETNGLVQTVPLVV